MHVTFYGTRGSVPVAGARFQKYGGNTTCVRIDSPCLPSQHWLAIDGGTGIVPLGKDALAGNIKELSLLMTHHHHDHNQGLLMCPLTFHKGVRVNCYGPIEYQVGPKQVMEQIMRPPYFPVKFAIVQDHFRFKPIEHPESTVLVFHPEGGAKITTVNTLDGIKRKQPCQIPMNGGCYPLGECLLVTMIKTEHPEYAVSYRITEGPTGKTFVFLTDHENTDGLPPKLRAHLKGTDLLAADCQYSRKKYDAMTAGFGHSTPDYCVRLAKFGEVPRLMLTHHDPESGDEQVDAILQEALAAAETQGYTGNILPCADFLTVEV